MDANTDRGMLDEKWNTYIVSRNFPTRCLLNKKEKLKGIRILAAFI